MAKCLLVAATAAEIAPFLKASNEKAHSNVDVLITGVGMVATAFHLGRKLSTNTYDFAINVGIAGAVSKELTLGELVFVEHDFFYELGAEDNDDFLSIEQLGFGKSVFNAIPGVASKWYSGLKRVNGVTVNKVHGNEASIYQLQQRTSADIESMEGAAFYYACTAVALPCIQVRSISNYVERRDREKWQIGLAVNNLNRWLISCGKHLL